MSARNADIVTLLDIQDRIKTLLEADAYFAGASIITEHVGTLETEIAKAVARTGFYVAIRNSGGELRSPELNLNIFRERFEVTIAQNPLTDASRATRNVQDGMVVAAKALIGQEVSVGDKRRMHVLRHAGAYTDKGLALQVFELMVDTELTVS